jgi:tetratricopeptide (TPR) repeat protein
LFHPWASHKTGSDLKKVIFFIPGLIFVLLPGCSSERNTWTSKAYHNLTAHYNGYFYADVEIRKIEDAIRAAHIDDYSRILRLFPTFDSTLAKSYEANVEEAIKMASIAIQRHPNSKWVDDAYILVGKARMYSLDWGNAIETFKYVNTKSEDPDARHRAIINLIRTFTEHREYNNAQAAIDYLLKEDLNKQNRKDLLLEKAYFHQVQEDYDNMVRSLTEATPLLKKSDRSGRIFFILGQVYQELGFESEAFNFYRRCLATNPEYETDFYARLYMAQVAEISRSRDITAARKSFRRLLKDNKNRDFRDRIYYELGTFELKQKNIQQAIANYNLAIREGTDKRVDGEAYLGLGQIYYDTLRDYAMSQAYYDSAIGALPPDFENYAAIKQRQEVLNEFVANLKTIEWQDSLLAMASLDSAALRARIDSVFAARALAEQAATKGKKKRKRNRIELEANTGNIFGAGESSTGTSDWYFGNPSAMALGESEFRRIWGNIRLEDNWRRSMRLTDAPGIATEVATITVDSISAQPIAAAEPVDPAEAEFVRLDQQIPRTEEQRAAALKKIEDAYFRVGDIYYFDLLEKDNAQKTYLKLLERFPESEYAAEVLYKLYLIAKESDPDRARQLSDRLIAEHPYSTFARILANPDYLLESSQTAEQQKALYSEAYAHYQASNYVDARRIAQNGIALGETAFTPQLQLLLALITGGLEGVGEYQEALAEFIRTNPDSELIPYAQKLLETSRKYQSQDTLSYAPRYTYSASEPHYFVIVHARADSGVVEALEAFNRNHFAEAKLSTTEMGLDGNRAMAVVSHFPDEAAARQYYKTFIEQAAALGDAQDRRHDKVLISSVNFNILYRTKGWDEYVKFFERNYRPQTP